MILCAVIEFILSASMAFVAIALATAVGAGVHALGGSLFACVAAASVVGVSLAIAAVWTGIEWRWGRRR